MCGFSSTIPVKTCRHLEILDSYWVRNIPLGEKLGTWFREYLEGLNLFYWYLPNEADAERHRMLGYGISCAIPCPSYWLVWGLRLPVSPQ